MEKCVIYSRVSTDLQTTESQLSKLREFAIKNSLEISKEFKETISGYKEGIHREAYELMKEYVIQNDIKIILVWEISRIGRRMNVLVDEITSLAETHKVNIHSLDGPIKDTMVDGKLNYFLVGIMSAMVQMERDTIKSRISRGIDEAAHQGKRAGLGTLPYGYTNIDKYIQIDNEEAKIVKDIFEMFADNVSIRKICHTLNAKGVLTRNQKLGYVNVNKHTNRDIAYSWQPSTINGIVRNTFYIGKRRYKGEFINVPRIINEDLWKRAQQRKGDKIGYRDKVVKYKYLVKTKMKCGECGSNINVRIINAKRTKVYVCSSNNNVANPCTLGSIKTDEFDDVIFKILLNHKDFYMAMKEDEYDNFNPKEKEGQIIYFKSLLNDLTNRKRRVVKLYRDGLYSDEDLKNEISTIEKETEEFSNEIVNIKRTIKEFTSRREHKSYKKELSKNWETDDFNKRKYFIDKYLQSIKVQLINDIDTTDDVIDSTRMAPWRKERLKIYNERMPQRRKMHYIEIVAFGSNKPIKMVLYNYRNETYFTDRFQLNSGTLTIES
jgi:site-specific DNA recombinase